MSHKKYLSNVVLGILFLVFILAALWLFPEKAKKSFWGNEIKEIRIGENIFQAEIVSDPAKRKQGLSGRKNLCGNCAMLFIFEKKGKYPFWMKKMDFDLDIVWIYREEVVHIAKNVSHEKELELIKPDREADKVLEINAGLADKLGIKFGDKIGF